MVAVDFVCEVEVIVNDKVVDDSFFVGKSLLQKSLSHVLTTKLVGRS